MYIKLEAHTVPLMIYFYIYEKQIPRDIPISSANGNGKTSARLFKSF